jgi:hypothetical protein
MDLLLQKAGIRAHKKICDDLKDGGHADVSILYRGHISADDVEYSKNVSKVVLIVSKRYTDAELPDHEQIDIKSDGLIELRYDIFSVIFYYITCQPELKLQKNGKDVDSLLSRLSPESQGLYGEPFLNPYFEKFESLLCGIEDNAQKQPRYPSGRQFAVALTHDIDIVSDSLKQKLKQIVHLKNRRKDLLTKEELLAFFKRIFSLRNDYFKIYELMELERLHGIFSTVNFYVNISDADGARFKDTLKNKLYDPQYDLLTSGKLRRCIKDLTNGGWEIGLHGSYGSSKNGNLFDREKDMLEKVALVKILGCRQHFLNMRLPATWRFQRDAGLNYDTSLGFRHSNGFRAGVAHPFYPYDTEKEETIDLLQIPLVIMDTCIFDRENLSVEGVLKECSRILSLVKECNGAVSVNWHQRAFNKELFPGWKEAYEFVIKWSKDNNGYLTTAKDVFDLWTNSRASQKIKEYNHVRK